MSDARWFEQYRMDWIMETIRVFGFINRGHICRKFGISAPQASMDLQNFQRRYPATITYSTTEKCYLADDFRPIGSKKPGLTGGITG